MSVPRFPIVFPLALSTMLMAPSCGLAEVPGAPPAKTASEKDSEEAASNTPKAKGGTVSVAIARQRAKLAHHIYAATLEVMHDRYFHGDRAAVPARTLQDVFDEIARKENLQAKWIAVNAKVMSIDHRPKSAFEKLAAKSIKAGKMDCEQVDDGVYHRAQAISLMGRGCLGCHLDFGASGRVQRFAGLVISIPVHKDAAEVADAPVADAPASAKPATQP